MDVSFKPTLQRNDALMREAEEGTGRCVALRGSRHGSGRGRRRSPGQKIDQAAERWRRHLCAALNNRLGCLDFITTVGSSAGVGSDKSSVFEKWFW